MNPGHCEHPSCKIDPKADPSMLKKIGLHPMSYFMSSVQKPPKDYWVCQYHYDIYSNNYRCRDCKETIHESGVIACQRGRHAHMKTMKSDVKSRYEYFITYTLDKKKGSKEQLLKKVLSYAKLSGMLYLKIVCEHWDDESNPHIHAKVALHPRRCKGKYSKPKMDRAPFKTSLGQTKTIPIYDWDKCETGYFDKENKPEILIDLITNPEIRVQTSDEILYAAKIQTKVPT